MRSFRPPRNDSPPPALPALLHATHLFGVGAQWELPGGSGA
jgi:hypothetical protein